MSEYDEALRKWGGDCADTSVDEDDFHAGWNAALDAAEKVMPTVGENYGDEHQRGWDDCAAITHEALAKLKEQA